MREHIIEPKYNYQVFLIFFLVGFFLWLTMFYLFFNYEYSQMKTITWIILLTGSLVMGLFLATIVMFSTKRKSITIPFTDKKEFMDKMNIFLFQIGYMKDFNQDNFFSYKPSFKAGVLSGKIYVTLNKNNANIDGPFGHLKKFKDLF
jgi:hypothetical protein